MEKRREHIRKKLDAFVLGSSVAIVDRATTRFREEVVDALLDGTVYSIVESLKELQSLRERELFNLRQSEVLKLDPESENFDEKILEIDKQIITRIDETAKEQQSTLICAGVPGFQSSNDATEISFQMAVIKFILSLESVYSSY